MTMTPDFGRIHAVMHIAKAINAQTYLEIGCRDDECFGRMKEIVPFSVGIDPVMGGTLRMTSDEYFADLFEIVGSVPGGKAIVGRYMPPSFDLIFIDGDHHHDQVAKDLRNSIAALSLDGVIVMHDVWPFAPHMEDISYSGTVWRAFVKEGRTKRHVEGFSAIIPGDPVGVGVLRLRQNTLLIDDPMVQAMDAMQLKDMFEHEHDWMRRRPFDQVMTALGLPRP